MSVTGVSTTDAPEVVAEVLGDLAKDAPKVEESKTSAPEESEAKNATDDSGETAEDSDPSENDGEKPKKKPGFKRRVEKLNKKLSKAESEAAYWREQALKHQRPEPEPTPVREPDGKPSAEYFETHEAYMDALTDWKLEKKLAEKESVQRQREIKNEQGKIFDTHIKRVEEFKSQRPDFIEVIEEVEDVNIPPAVQELILNSDQGPALMYELAKAPDELARICSLSPLAAAREMGKLEAKLSQKESPQIKKTKAPPPIKPVGAKSSASIQKDPEQMSYQEFKRWREENLKY